MKKQDFTVSNHGTLSILTPVSRKAKAWAKEHLQVQPYQRIGNGIAIEHRFVNNILDGIRADSMTIQYL